MGRVTMRIGPEGGRLAHPSGATVEVPAGALDEPVEIGIEARPASSIAAVGPDGLVVGSTIYAVTPHRHRFDAPVTITIPREPDQNVLLRADDDTSPSFDVMEPSYGADVFVHETEHLSHYGGAHQEEPGTGFDIVARVCQHVGIGGPGTPETPRFDYLCGADSPLLAPSGSLHQLVARFPLRLDIELFAAEVGRGIVDIQLNRDSPIYGVQWGWIRPVGGDWQFLGHIPKDDPLVGCQGCALPCPSWKTVVLEPGTYECRTESYVSHLCTQTSFNTLLCPGELTQETAMRGYAEGTFTVVAGACSPGCTLTLGPPPPSGPSSCDATEGASAPCGPPAQCDRTDCLTLNGMPVGTHCGNPDSQELQLQNDCGETVALRYCLWNSSGSAWDCGVSSTFAPGATSSGAWTCEGDGRHYYSAMPAAEYGNGTCVFGRLAGE
jgi:hypothetical protein